jgi:hypothetical protein
MIPRSFAQVPGTSPALTFQPERYSALSAWLAALDGFLADSAQMNKADAGYRSWMKWAAPAKLSSHAGLPDSSPSPDSPGPARPEPVFKDFASQALNELAMISFGISSGVDGLVIVSRLPAFVSAAAVLLETRALDSLAGAADLHDGANPLRVLQAFLSALTAREREAFRVLAGIDAAALARLLDFSSSDYAEVSMPGLSVPGTWEPIAPALVPGSAELLEAERLLVSWRSSRLKVAQLRQGSLSYADARSEAGRHLADLLATEYGRLVFNPGWTGERFAKDAKQDLDAAWSAMGRSVAADLRREAAPWLARRLGTTGTPSFSLEYSVQPSPSNAYLALMTMRAVVNGVSYSIPYQVAARALSSASTEHFEDAPAPLRYIEEPLPGLRIYAPRDEADSSKAVAGLEADLAAAYPSALHVPAALLQLPAYSASSCEERCIALDAAYRETASGVRLARFFSELLYSHSFPELAALILPKNQALPEFGTGGKGNNGTVINDEKSGVD